MEWIGWAVIAAIAAAAGLLVRRLYSENGGGHPCCGCGKCLETGFCVLGRKKPMEKGEKPEESDLTNSIKGI